MKKKGLLARNTLVNFLGQGIPLFFALLAIPFVIEGLGTDRYGVLTIVWVVIGYFGLFDMGIGRATTKFVADFEARGDKHLSPIILTSILLLIVIGLVGGGVVVLATPWLVEFLKIPDDMLQETTHAFYVLSLSIPLVLGSIGARGALEAQQRFNIVNAIKIPASTLNYLAPLLMLPFTTSLQYIVMVMVLGRGLTFAGYFWFSIKDEKTFHISEYPIVQWTRDLFGFGAWITVSNLISPIMVYMDRFILGGIISMTAVAYYTTPYDVVSRLLIVSGSFMGVMFPAFSVASMENRSELGPLHRKSLRYLLLVLVPVVIFLVISGEALLYFWVGGEFAANSTLVLQLLSVGVLVNALAMVPYTALQAMGRPDITAKLHMVELPIYLVLLWQLSMAYGIVGAAMTWVIRVTLDGGLLLYFFRRLVPDYEHRSGHTLSRAVTGALGLAGMAAGYWLIPGRTLIIAFGLGAALLTFWYFWTYILHEHERTKIYRLYIDIREVIRNRGRAGT